MIRYAYKVVTIGINEYQETLTYWGARGWMYIGHHDPQTPLGHDTGKREITFQRELGPGEGKPEEGVGSPYEFDAFRQPTPGAKDPIQPRRRWSRHDG